MKNRNPGAEYITPIAKFFGVSERYLLTGEEAAPARWDYMVTPESGGEALILEYWRRMNEFGHLRAMIAVNEIMRDPKALSENQQNESGTPSIE